MLWKLTQSLFAGKIYAGKSSYDSDSSSLKVAASEKVLVPGGQSDGSSPSIDELETPETALEGHKVVIHVLQIHNHTVVPII